MADLSAYQTKYMLAFLEEILPPRSYLLDTFFPEVEIQPAESFDIDIVKNKPKLAKFVAKGHEAELISRDGYETKTIKPPYIYEYMALKAMEALLRAPGTSQYLPPNGNNSSLISQQAARDLRTLQDRIIRREEYMAAEILNTGVLTIRGKGVDATLDYGMAAAGHVLNAGTDWDDGGADPLADLATWAKKIQDDSGFVPDVCIMGSDAITAFLANANVQKLLNLLNYNVGKIEPKDFGPNVREVARIITPQVSLPIYLYTEVYTDDNDATQSYVPVDKVWLGSTKARNKRLYGAIPVIDLVNGGGAGLEKVRWYPHSWSTENPRAWNLSLESSPLPAMFQPKAFLSAKVLNT